MKCPRPFATKKIIHELITPNAVITGDLMNVNLRIVVNVKYSAKNSVKEAMKAKINTFIEEGEIT
tara:strand:+ start:2007 stop:2201 length:195 start_codon:yes stop_codon:yes gene_type:complete